MAHGWLIGVMVELPGEPIALRHFFAVGHADRAKAEWSAIDQALLIGPVSASPGRRSGASPHGQRALRHDGHARLRSSQARCARSGGAGPAAGRHLNRDQLIEPRKPTGANRNDTGSAPTARPAFGALASLPGGFRGILVMGPTDRGWAGGVRRPRRPRGRRPGSSAPGPAGGGRRRRSSSTSRSAVRRRSRAGASRSQSTRSAGAPTASRPAARPIALAGASVTVSIRRSSGARPSWCRLSSAGSSVSRPIAPGAASSNGRRLSSAGAGRVGGDHDVDQAGRPAPRSAPGGRPRRAAAASSFQKVR